MKYGEPWRTTNARDGSIIDRDERPVFESLKYVKRSVQCVNACAGIDNPGKVIKDAANLIERLIPYIPSNAVDMKLALNGPIEDARLTNIAAKVLKTLRPEQD